MVFAHAGEREEAIVGVPGARQAALRSGRRAVRRVGEAARVGRHNVEVTSRLATVDGVQLLKVADVVDRHARHVGSRWARRSEQDQRIRIAGLDAGGARFEQWQIGGGIDVAGAGLAIQVLLVPELVRLDLAGVARGHCLHEVAVSGRVARHEPTGVGAIEHRRVREAQHDLQAGGAGVADDVVELGEVVVAGLDLDLLPLELLGDPVEAGLGHVADDVRAGDAVVVPELDVVAIAPATGVGRRRLGGRGDGREGHQRGDQTTRPEPCEAYP